MPKSKVKARNYVKEFVDWNNVTGALNIGCGWYYECLSILEDAQKEIEQLRKITRRKND